MTTTLPPEARARAAVLYQSGASIRAIATALNASYSRVRNSLIEDGVPLRPRGRPSSSPAPARIVQPPYPVSHARARRPFPLEKATAMYEAGKTLRQIAAKTGYSRSRVHVYLTEAGVQMRTVKHPRASRITAAKRRAILRGVRAGRSNAEITTQVRTTTTTINRVVSEAGLAPRRRTRKHDHDRMKRLRTVEGWTLAEVAAEMGTTPQYVWTIVNGCHLKSYVKRGHRRAHADAT